MSRIRWDGDASTAVRAQEALTAAQKKFEEQCGKSVAKTKELEAAAKKLTEQTNPQARFNSKMEELAKHMKAGTMSIEQASIAAKKYQRDLDAASQSGEKAFGSGMLSNIKGLAAGALSVAAAVKLITSEIQASVDQADRIAQRQADAADPRRALKKNIFGYSDKDQAFIERSADETAAALSLPQSTVDLAFAQSVSASSDPRQAAKFTKFALQFDRDPNSAASTTGALLDIANALGTDDPKRALGYLGLTAQNSRPSSLKQVSENLPRAVNSILAGGGDSGQGGALFAGLTIGNADTMGETSRTAILSMNKRLDAFFGSKKAAAYKAGSLDDVREQLPALFKDRALAQAFVTENDFGAAQPGMVGLLTDPNSAARKKYDAAILALASPDSQIAAGERALATLKTGKFEGARRLQDVVGSLDEQLDLLAPSDDLTKDSRNALMNIRQKFTGTRAGAELGVMLDSGTVTTNSEATAILGQILAELRNPTKVTPSYGVDPWGATSGVSVTTRAPTSLEKSQAALLQEAVNQLNEIKNQRRSSAATRADER